MCATYLMINFLKKFSLSKIEKNNFLFRGIKTQYAGKHIPAAVAFHPICTQIQSPLFAIHVVVMPSCHHDLSFFPFFKITEIISQNHRSCNCHVVLIHVIYNNDALSEALHDGDQMCESSSYKRTFWVWLIQVENWMAK